MFKDGARTIQWNASSPRFSAYTSTQTAIQIYKLSTGGVEVPDCGEGNHTAEVVLGKEATCTETGLTEGSKCSVCGTVLTAQETIEMIPHNYVDGYCSVCGRIEEPEADTELTIAQALQLGAAMGHDKYTEGKYYVTGEITEVYNTTYGNMYITDGENTLTIYGTYSADGTISYDAMETKPIAGDTVTVYGVIGAYGSSNPVPQMKNGWIVEHEQTGCPHENTYEADDAKAPTCTETGLSATVMCSDCGEVVKEQETVPADGHDFAGGDKCVVCGEVKPAGYTLTDLGAITATQQVVITMSKDGTTWALTNNNGASKAPTAVTVAANGGVIAANDVTEELLWNVVVDANGNITIHPNGTTETWLYSTNANNGTRVGDNDNKTWVLDASGYLKHVGTNRYLGVYSGQDWRSYTNTTGNTAGQTLGFYVAGTAAEEPEHVCTPAEAVIENNVAATCTTAGSYDSVIYCSDPECGKEISRETITVDALGHKYDAVVTAPTCTTGGYTTYTCSVCGDTYTADEVDALGHAYDAVVTAPTCTTGGYTTYTCSVCGDTYVADEVAATGHRYSNVEVTSPTCTEDGWITIDCGNCGGSWDSRYDQEAKDYLVDYPFFQLTAKGHSYEAVVTAPTCTTAGYTTYTCSVCGDTYVADEVDALGHTWDAGVYTEPTYEADGYTTYTCTVCGETNVVTDEGTMKNELVITGQPESITAEEDTEVTFTVAATGDGLTYQWMYSKNGGTTWSNTSMTGATSATLIVKAYESRNGYMYCCRVSDAYGSRVFTEYATLTVTAPEGTGAITEQPTDATVVEGTSATFTVVATGTDLQYQWQYSKDGTTWYNTTMAGNTSATLIVPAYASRNGYQYRCRITDTFGNRLTTNVVTLTVTKDPTAQPTDQTVSVGAIATFTVGETKDGYTYQWMYSKNGGTTWSNTTMAGNTSATLTVPAYASRDGYQYCCRIIDDQGRMTYSDPATLTVVE